MTLMPRSTQMSRTVPTRSHRQSNTFMPRGSASPFTTFHSGSRRSGCSSRSPCSVSIGASFFCTQDPGPIPASNGLPTGDNGVPAN